MSVRTNVIQAIHDIAESLDELPHPQVRSRLKTIAHTIIDHWPLPPGPGWGKAFVVRSVTDDPDDLRIFEANYRREIRAIRIDRSGKSILLYLDGGPHTTTWYLRLPLHVWQDVISRVQAAIDSEE